VRPRSGISLLFLPTITACGHYDGEHCISIGATEGAHETRPRRYAGRGVLLYDKSHKNGGSAARSGSCKMSFLQRAFASLAVLAFITVVMTGEYMAWTRVLL